MTLQAAHVVVPVKETLVGLGDLRSTNVSDSFVYAA